MRSFGLIMAVSAVAFLPSKSWASGEAIPDSADARMVELAAELAATLVDIEPTKTLYADLGLANLPHDRLADPSPEARMRQDAAIDRLYADLQVIDRYDLSTKALVRDYAIAKHELEMARALRVCRQELWSVSHMAGWPAYGGLWAGLQRVSTAAEQEDALVRWGSLPEFIDKDIANLRRGLRLGYSSPSAVVERVILLVDGMIVEESSRSPFYILAKNSGDPEFADEVSRLITSEIIPAIVRYRDFLRDEYLESSREELSVLALPDGKQCYEALLHDSTTLAVSGEDTARRGASIVAANVAEVEAIGKEAYGTSDFTEIIRRMQNDPGSKFEHSEQLFAFVTDLVARSKTVSERLFDRVPDQEVEIRLANAAQEAAGVSSSYTRNSDPDRAAIFLLNPVQSSDATQASLLALHEVYPGHHLQFGYSLGLENSDLSKLFVASAFSEGWARYAEILSEEVGLLHTPQQRIARRSWPARGMVADPSLHIGGWTRDELRRYLIETGRWADSDIDPLIDRIAIWPGQLTSYDTGAQEILSLRAEAQFTLGEEFDLKKFHAVVLGSGSVPLSFLREEVEAWIARGGG